MATSSQAQNTLETKLSHTTALAAPRPKHRFRQRSLWELVPAALGMLWLIFSFYPILYMLFTSLRPQQDLFTDVPWSFPSHPTLQNYTTVLDNGFVTYFTNTVFVTVVSVLVIVVVSLLAAYPISQVRSRYTRNIFNLFLLGLAIPLQATIIPIYAIVCRSKNTIISSGKDICTRIDKAPYIINR